MSEHPELLSPLDEASEEVRRRLLLEGIADVRAGRVVDDDAVRAWIHSLATDKPLPPPRPSDEW